VTATFEGDASAAVVRLEDLLHDIAESLQLDAEVSVEVSEGTITGRLDGDDLGTFIGRRGQTINAVQHLAQRIVVRGDDGWIRVVIDADDYRARRAEALRADADDAAEEAVRTGRAVELNPMPSIERRLIHEHLRDRLDVETSSEGDEPDRFLVIFPIGE
jgi:spoIIIJ-associated protein